MNNQQCIKVVNFGHRKAINLTRVLILFWSGIPYDKELLDLIINRVLSTSGMAVYAEKSRRPLARTRDDDIARL